MLPIGEKILPRDIEDELKESYLNYSMNVIVNRALPDVRDGISECTRVLRPRGRFLFIATKNSFMGKLIAGTWMNKVLDPAHVRDCMMRAGIGQVENLRFPWYFKHVDATVMALLGEKA